MKNNSRAGYTVSQVNAYVKQMFQTDFVLSNICVQGEISNVTYHGSGHIYFTLKDNSSQLSCVMFRSSRTNGLKFQLKQGQQIQVTGQISVFERDGRYQLYANKITCSGEGQLYERFLQLKNQLEEEGLFSEIYKQKLPLYAKKIGIVTAQTGAAIQDIINISTRRNPYIELVLYPAKVQGTGSAESVVAGIRALVKEQPDVIIVGRGGGSIEDLWAFNEEIVARAIFDCTIPIVSAVGHETDFTIADFVADLRAPTPSAAAELCVCNIHDVLFTISEYERTLENALSSKIISNRLRLENLTSRLKQFDPVHQTQLSKERLLHHKQQLMTAMERNLNRNKERIAGTPERLSVAMNRNLERQQEQLRYLAQRLNDLSPLLSLGRGYSYLTDDNGKNICSVKDLESDQQVHIRLKDGSADAKIM